ncbi:MAG: dUTP diphosphatase [Bilophila sp.]
MASTCPHVQLCYLRDAQALYEQGLCYATPGSVGLDLRACLEADEVEILAGARLAVPVGVAVEPLTPGIAGFVYSRSGLGAVQGLTVAQGVGVIDPDYRGEITVVLLNTSGEVRRLRRGERIAQLVFQPVVQVALREVATLGTTDRGAGGFGHTGTK